MEEAKELLLDPLLGSLRSLGDENTVEAGQPLAEGKLEISLTPEGSASRCYTRPRLRRRSSAVRAADS